MIYHLENNLLLKLIQINLSMNFLVFQLSHGHFIQWPSINITGV
jgi:hypothetical protein